MTTLREFEKDLEEMAEEFGFEDELLKRVREIQEKLKQIEPDKHLYYRGKGEDRTKGTHSCYCWCNETETLKFGFDKRFLEENHQYFWKDDDHGR